MDEMEEHLTIEMIQAGTYRKIAEAIGISNLIKLSELIGGTTSYFPKSESFLRPVRDMRIKEEFNGCNHQELAIKYNVTERWVRQLCGEGITEGQIAFDELF